MAKPVIKGVDDRVVATRFRYECDGEKVLRIYLVETYAAARLGKESLGEDPNSLVFSSYEKETLQRDCVREEQMLAAIEEEEAKIEAEEEEEFKDLLGSTPDEVEYTDEIE